MNHCVPCYMAGQTITPASFMVQGTSMCIVHVVEHSPSGFRKKPTIEFVDLPGDKKKKASNRKAPSSK